MAPTLPRGDIPWRFLRGNRFVEKRYAAIDAEFNNDATQDGSDDMITSVGDMLKLDSALRSHVVLDAAYFTTMTTPTGIPEEPDAS